MKIIKKGDIPVDQLTEITKVFEQHVTCELCKTVYQPNLQDFILTTNYKAKSDSSLEYSLVGEVHCPICNKTHYVYMRNLEQTVCAMMKKWGRE